MNEPKRKNPTTPLNMTWDPTEKRLSREKPQRTEAPSIPYTDIFTRFEVEPEFHESFAVFVETGSAPAEFTYRLEHNANWQLALEKAFERRVGRLQEVLRVLLPAETEPKTRTEDGGR